MTGAEGQANAIITTIYPNPFMLSHAMDPSSTDFRAFFPYTPNEVKHRKRTTGPQLKVLENIFKHDTKPNANLRKELANQLDMTARGVQVWFQNRRAKEKNRSSRVAGKASADTTLDESDQLSKESSVPPYTDSLTESSKDSPASTNGMSDAVSQTSSPSIATRPFFRINTHGSTTTDSSANTSWQNSPVEPPPLLSSYINRSSNDISDIQIASYRRGSLPIDALSPTSSLTQPTHGPPVIDQLDPLARRRSVDASLQRLAHNPYASVARARNAQLYGSSRVVAHGHHHPAVWFGPPGRPTMQHRGALPSEPELRRSVSFSNGNAPSPPSNHSSRLSVPNHYISQRSISSHPLPGPLPSPGFSFGAPYPTSSPPLTTPALEHDRSSPESFQFGYRSDDLETEDDAAYEAISRFGSIASAVSESSTFYSEGLCAVEEGMEAKLMRRDSCAPAFLESMENLDMSRSHASPALPYEDSRNANDGSTSLDGALHVQESLDGPMSYPSPSSTISPGDNSPPSHQAGTPSNGGISISRSSELAFALRETKAETLTPSVTSHVEQQQPSLVEVASAQPDFVDMVTQPPHQAYSVFDQDGSYGASSTSNLPLTYPFPDADYPNVSVSPPEHYHTPNMYSNGPHEDLSMLQHGHSMEYMQCTTATNEASVGLGVYEMYPHGGTV